MNWAPAWPNWKPTLPRLLTGALLAAAAASTFLSSMPWLRGHQVARAPLLLVLAAVLPVAISTVTTRVARWLPLASYGMSGAGLVLFLALSNGLDVAGTWDGLVHVPAQLLTVTLPLSGGPSLLAGPLVLTWLCGAVSAELLVRPARPIAMGVAVPVLNFSIAYAAVTSAPQAGRITVAAALLGTLALTALARQALIDEEATTAERSQSTGRGPSPGDAAAGRAPGRRRAVRRAVTGAGVTAVLTAALAVTVSGLPALAAKPATLSRPTQLLTATVVDPLDALAALRRSHPGAKPQDLFAISVQQPWSGYIPLATLDQYDGDSWTFSDTFRPTGGRVPSPSANVVSEPGALQLVQTYTLEQPIGLNFLPALDRPEEVGGMAVDADAATGMLAASPALPASYTVVSQVPPGTLQSMSPVSELAVGDNIPGGDTPAYTSLPTGSATDVSAAVRFAVNLTGLPASASLGFLQSLDSALREQERRVNPRLTVDAQPAAVAGTSLAQVMNAVTVDRAATPEQFATFFAVVARYLGVPVRVVTGFRVPAAATSPGPIAAGQYQLTNRDAWTWDEVPVLGEGWVVVEPTPVLTTADAVAPPEQVTATHKAKPKQATALPGKGAAHAIAKPVSVKLKHVVHVDWLALFALGVPALAIAALLLGLLALPALRRRLRRLARHRAHDPALLTAGAWLELIDGLFRLGLDVDPSATGHDVADEVASRFGDDFGPPAVVLAGLADQALYSTQWPVDEAGAHLAWDTQRQLYRDLRSSVGQRDRARALALVGTTPARPGPGGAS